MNLAPVSRPALLADAGPVVMTGRILQALVAQGVNVPDDDETLRQIAQCAGSVQPSDAAYLRGVITAAQRERRERQNAAVRRETIARALGDAPPRRHLAVVR
jgi:hypothetical protein